MYLCQLMVENEKSLMFSHRENSLNGSQQQIFQYSKSLTLSQRKLLISRIEEAFENKGYAQEAI